MSAVLVPDDKDFSKDVSMAQEGFASRHIGPRAGEVDEMLALCGAKSVAEFIEQVIPGRIRAKSAFRVDAFDAPLSEVKALARLQAHARKNQVWKNFIGLGYYDCHTPGVIQRNILENPGWYTQYTPYQPEISQGRLEALLNFQTMACDLTGMEIANASMLDEGTAAAEAMAMSFAIRGDNAPAAFFISATCHPQTIAVVQTRAEVLGIKTIVAEPQKFDFSEPVTGVLLQYPDTNGNVEDIQAFVTKAKAQNVVVTVVTDLLALTLLKPPAELDADIAVGSSQRFGVPLGFGGPHAAFFATKDAHKRNMPGRLVGLSKDNSGRPALRLALQTREQHIRREKATSNICTAQVLLAVMASMYAVYHGPDGLKAIAGRVHALAAGLARALEKAGLTLVHKNFFDTLKISVTGPLQDIKDRAAKRQINLRYEADAVIVSLDETTNEEDIDTLVYVLTGKEQVCAADLELRIPAGLRRNSAFLAHPVFNTHRSETEFLRYVKKLESRDLSLAVSMIPLGSCTMKLNATSEMLPVTWPEFSSLHPFAPKEQVSGYVAMFRELETALCDVTGFSAVSLQPNAGSQGEYAGLLAIRGYLDAKGQKERNICLIPKSAHGTNPASAVMAGLQVVVVACDENGNIDVEDLKQKAETHKAALACLMVTYPSTHGVFEESIIDVCEIVHNAGGQVYMDGANLNALVGLCKPAELGADVCHINLHKTFCIPHGGGGPGMGPIGVAAHLAPFLPGHPYGPAERNGAVGPVSAAPWGSASILPISWMYMAMMGTAQLKRASEIAILNANYIATRLGSHFPVLYKGGKGRVAHECIFDFRGFKQTAGIEVEDIAKRLMDFGFHAPTISFPVPGTIMVEPTESESKAELDRFCEAMITIGQEIAAIAAGKSDKADNPLKNAPHTALAVTADSWAHGYSREVAAYPAPWTKEYKFWPAVGRIDGAYGDRNLICSCPPLE